MTAPTTNEQPSAIEIFISYAHTDERFKNELETRLIVLKRQGKITDWNNRRILAGAPWQSDISEHLESAHIILLLISADFLASDYCYDVEMKRAIERHDAREACVIPVIIRSAQWLGTILGRLQALPKDGKAVTTWPNRDIAYQNITEGICAVLETLPARPPQTDSQSSRTVKTPSMQSFDPPLEAVLRSSIVESSHTTSRHLRPMMETNDPWENKFWHYKVHQRLGENLYYFLIRVKPLNTMEIAKQLNKLLKDKNLGGVRVFPLFGSYDLVIRAWLPPGLDATFLMWLNDLKIGSSRAIHQFQVDHIDWRWYAEYDLTLQRLGYINEEMICAVQSDPKNARLQEFVNDHIVITRQADNNIHFFVAIELDQPTEAQLEQVSSGLIQHVKTTRGDDGEPLFKYASVYRGFGFCHVLFKGQVADYNRIAELPTWISIRFEDYGATTETYLVHHGTHIVGSEAIGFATFNALRGRDPVVQWIIPEIYDHPDQSRRKVIELFLTQEGLEHQPNDRERKLFHDYLLGYLHGDATQMAQTLFTFFFELEHYLRDNHKEYIGRQKLSINDVYQAAGVQESRPNPALGDILNIYSRAIQMAKVGEGLNLAGGWQAMVEIRNVLMHGDFDMMKKWDSVLKQLLPYLPRLRKLLPLIEQTTGKPFKGSYIGSDPMG